MDTMLRTQIQLTEDQARLLKRLARQKQVSLAEVIRQSVDLYIATAGERPLDEQYARALAVAGKYRSGDTDLGRNHDDYLADAYATNGNTTGE
ncbi:MAG: CopG family transcriptional regulator [Rhizobiaceae bacterium]